MIHLDTSFLIRALVRHSAEDRRLRDWLSTGGPLAMSCISWAEFLCGPVPEREARLAASMIRDLISFVPEDSVLAARLFNLAGRRRGSLTDCMIAATALRVEASLATANPGDFRKLVPAGLKVFAA